MPAILQINSVINSGSTGRIAEAIGQLVIAHGWKSYIAYARNESSSLSNKIKIGNKFDISVHGIATRLFDIHGLASHNATKKFMKQIEKIKPDIIHLHNIHGYYINYKLLFEYLTSNSIPVVWTLHDCWTFTGHCPYFVYVNCDKWKTECFNCPQKKSYPASFFLDRAKKNFKDKKESFLSIADKLTLAPVSNWLADLCRQSFFKNVQIKKIYNGVDIDIFKPATEEEIKITRQKYNINTKYFILGVASVWSKRKGLDDFIQLSKILPADYSILLVGLTEKQIKNLPQGIIGISRTENIGELVKIYSSADLFFNPSVEETFGLTTIESIACGIPAIVYNSSGAHELLIKNTGFSVKPKDFDSILNAVNIIMGNDMLFYKKLCRNHAVKNFNAKERFLDYIKLYDEILSKNSD